jgi:hypothetical protein
VAGVLVAEGQLGHDRLDHALPAVRHVLGRLLAELDDLVRLEGHAAAAPVLVHDPADEPAFLVEGGRHPGGRDAVDGRRQDAATDRARVLHVPVRPARHVEPDLRLLEELSAGLVGVRALHEAEELVRRVQ